MSNLALRHNHTVAYHIKQRGGKTLYTVAHATPDLAFMAATYHIKGLYIKAGIQQPMFDGDPMFYFEGV